MATDVNFGVQQYFGFDPRSVPGCALWFDGSDSNSMTISGSSNVTQWNDKSGNARNTNAVTGTPVLSNLSSRQGVYFDGASSFSGSFSYSSNTLSWFVVATAESSGTAYGRILSFGIAGTLDYDATTKLVALYRDNNLQSVSTYRNAQITTGGTITYATPFLFYSGIDGTSNYPFINGSAVTGAATSGNFGFSGFALSAPFGTNTERNKGYIFEVITYTRHLSSTERQQVEGYLAWKWGTNSSLPTGHPYLYNRTYSRLFQPPDVDGLILWLDSADRGSNSMTLSGTTISTWLDKSGNGSNFSSSASPVGSAPVIGTLSNLPIVDTTAGGCFTNGSSSVPITYSGFTTGYSTITAAANTWAGLFYGTPDAIFMLRAFQAQMFLWKGNGTNWGNPSVVTGPTTTTNTIWSFTNPTAAGASTLWVNGTLNQSNTGTTNIATTGLDIGRWVNNTYPWKGYYGDVIFYNVGLSDADRQRVEGFLGWKMGLRGSLPTTHPFYNIPPTTPAFHPMLLSNSTLWLDGADSTTNSMTFSGANITVWKDKSSNGRNFTGGATSATLNTNPAGLLFSSATSRYTSTHNASITTNETMFLVFYSTKTTSPSFPIGSSAAGGRELGFRTTTDFGIVNNGVQWGAQATATSNTLYLASSFISNSGVSTAFGLNGGTLSTSNITAFSGTTTTQLGREGASSFLYEGTVCEVIAYSRVLTSNERRRVEGWLAWKWGLKNSLPTSHPYYSFRP